MANIHQLAYRVRKFFRMLYSQAHWYCGRRCEYCHWHRAVWYYAPGYAIACDECVPRGCGCNKDSDGTEPLDERGRRSPCCEWMMFGE